MLLVLFGPPGVGKSFVGRILSEDFGFYFYDADDDLTPDMIEAIRTETVFTPEMRHRFFNIVIEKIQQLQNKYPYIVVAQALIKEANRLQLQLALPQATFIHVLADMSNIKKRLKIRNNWVSVEYAEKICNIFEAPQMRHEKLDNNRDKTHIKAQLGDLLYTDNVSIAY